MTVIPLPDRVYHGSHLHKISDTLRRDAEQRSAILDGLRAKLAQGDKALVGNSGFRRYLKTVSAEHFAVDETRVAEDARFDGLYRRKWRRCPNIPWRFGCCGRVIDGVPAPYCLLSSL